MFSDKGQDNFLRRQENGLGKSAFWGAVGRVFAGIAGGIIETAGGPVGKFINKHLNDWIYNGEDVFKTGITPYEPTASEQAILDPWNKQKISPWIGKLAKELDAAFSASTIEDQIAKINKVMSKICYVKQYYVSKETAGLSVQAIQWRHEYLNVLLAPLLDLIVTTTSNKPISTKNMTNTGVNTTAADFAGIIPTANFTNNYNCNHYKVNAGVIELPVMEPIGTEPTTGLPVIVPISEPAPTGTGTATNPDGTPATEKTFLQKNGVPLALGVVALWALLSKKKKKN